MLHSHDFGFLSDSEADWLVDRVKSLLRGTMTQAAFSEECSMSQKGLERVFARKHRLSVKVARQIVTALVAVKSDARISLNKKHVVDLVCSMLDKRLARSIEAPAFSLAQQLIIADLLPAESLPKSFPLLLTAIRNLDSHAKLLSSYDFRERMALRSAAIRNLEKLCRLKLKERPERTHVMSWLRDEASYPI